MAPGEPYPHLAIVVHLVVSLVLFVSLFLAVFWTPGLVLGLFVSAYAADSNALSQLVDRRRRLRQVKVDARVSRGGWSTSAAARL